MKTAILAIITIFTLGAFNSNAQTAKIAHVQSSVVLDSIQSYKNIVAEEQKIYKDGQKQSEAIQKQLERMQQEYYAAVDTMSQFEEYLMRGDIEKKQNDLYMLEQVMQNQLNILQQRLVELMKMYKEAVAIVAKRHGLTYVLDADSQVLFASPEGKDLTDEVRTELLRMDKEKPVLE
ncbi:MAG: OmpH family outer membrane protein [Crocinitomicaceae bacterium]